MSTVLFKQPMPEFGASAQAQGQTTATSFYCVTRVGTQRDVLLVPKH